MLPGFRFLVAAIVFSLSLLIFGLGAAALFRAAHEQFASSSSWRTAPEGSYTSFLPPAEPPRPVLAMLRVEAPAASAPAPLPDLQPAASPADTAAEISAASVDTADAAPVVAAEPAAAPAQEVTVAAAAPAPAPDPIIVAAVTPSAVSADTGASEVAKTEPPPPLRQLQRRPQRRS